jgi:nucleoside-diphosphate-sugar epimerase
MDKHTLLITGAAGYVGAMLVEKFVTRADVAHIIGIDKEPMPEMFSGNSKLTYIHANTSDNWETQIGEIKPDIIIHTAWQIREIYGNRKLEWKWNIEGSDKIFDYAFSNKNVEKLIHFSTVASYGAYPDNTIEHRFTEDEPFRKMDYLYSEEKRISESHLHIKYEEAKTKNNNGHIPTVAIVRPAAITGPRGRYMRIRFGLQAALAGQLKDNFAYRLISKMVSFVPVTPKWCRQFIHEDDVLGIIERLTFSNSIKEGSYEIFNICPPGPVVLGDNMAHAVGKKTVRVQPWMVRIPFFFMWNLTRGKVPTGPGAWKSYSYPIAVDGSKVSKILGYTYKYESLDAFYYTNGDYESFVPANDIRHKA